MQTKRISAVFLSAVLLLSFLALASRATAGQSLTTDATILGQVTDESKAVLPGVTVTAMSPALQVASVTAVTDEKGGYRLTPLPIGTYTITYELSGFQTVRREGVRLTTGFTAKLDIALGVGSLQETVTVSGAAPQVDVTGTGAVTQITRELLEAIPTGGQGFVGILQMVPGARPRIDVGGNSVNTNPSLDAGSQGGGGGISQSWQSVDGVATKNPRITESGNYFDFTAVEEASVSTLGHDASVPSRGLNMNVVLASGGNQFHGKTYYARTSSKFESTCPPGVAGCGGLTLRDDFRADLGGRVIRDRLWFWAGFTNNRNHQDVPQCFDPEGKPCDQFQEARFYNTKWTAQLSPSNKIVGFIMSNRGPQERELSPLITYDARRVFLNEVDVSKIEWQGLRGNSLVLTANVGGWKGHSGTICPGGERSLATENVDLALCDQARVSKIDTVLGTISGLNTDAGGRLLESRYQARVNASYYKADLFHGNHEIKMGFDFFNAPQNRHNVGRGGGGNYQLSFRNGAPELIQFFNYPVHPDLVSHYYGTYVADSWTIGRRLTLNIGLRHAVDQSYEGASTRVAADGPSATIFPAATFQKRSMPTYTTWAPRLRAAYDLTGNGKSVVKGGWGRYQQMASADRTQLVAKNVLSAAQFTWRDLNLNKAYDPGEVNLSTTGPDFQAFVGARAGFTGGIVNPDETTPYTDEYSLQFEQQLTETVAVRVSGVERRYNNAQRIENGLRPYSAYTALAPRPDPGKDNVLGTADDPGKTITVYDFPSSMAGSAFLQGKIVNDPKANEKYHTIEVSVTKRLSQKWQFMASHSATKIDIPLTANFPPFNAVDPNAEINASNQTWEWMSRVSGSYLFPYGIMTSTNYELRSGNPLARTLRVTIPNYGAMTVRAEPVGSIALPDINLLSLRVDKRFELPKSQRLDLRMNLYNALNTLVATAMTVASGPNYGKVTATISPRIFDLSVQYQF